MGELGGFGIDPADKRKMWEEALDVSIRCMIEEPFTGFKGEHIEMPPRNVVPKPLQKLANSRAKILQCAATLTDSHNAVPLAVDFGRWTNPPYRRTPSAIFIFKSPNPSAVSVYVTPPTCTSGTIYTYRLVPVPG